MDAETHTWFGLSEEELRNALAEEFTIAFRAEGNTATIHGLAHSIALSESAHARPA